MMKGVEELHGLIPVAAPISTVTLSIVSGCSDGFSSLIAPASQGPGLEVTMKITPTLPAQGLGRGFAVLCKLSAYPTATFTALVSLARATPDPSSTLNTSNRV